MLSLDPDIDASETKVDQLEDWQQYAIKNIGLELLPCTRRYVILVFDEMKILEDLVYDKTGVYSHRFVNFGDVNEQLMKLEQSIDKDEPPELPTHMLTLMVRGLFMNLEYPYAIVCSS